MNTRTHLSLGKDAPASRPATPLADGRIVEIPQVNGLHHRYDRAAASRRFQILRRLCYRAS
jgi:putative transposase